MIVVIVPDGHNLPLLKRITLLKNYNFSRQDIEISSIYKRSTVSYAMTFFTSLTIFGSSSSSSFARSTISRLGSFLPPKPAFCMILIVASSASSGDICDLEMAPVVMATAGRLKNGDHRTAELAPKMPTSPLLLTRQHFKKL
jgi:ABC-type transport system involved in multi-copper enzyme maturation permease subunit